MRLHDKHFRSLVILGFALTTILVALCLKGVASEYEYRPTPGVVDSQLIHTMKISKPTVIRVGIDLVRVECAPDYKESK
jgi:hypothetical protein